MAERAGGALHHSWLVFGEHDVVFVYEMPDNTCIASALIAAASSGALKSLQRPP